MKSQANFLLTTLLLLFTIPIYGIKTVKSDIIIPQPLSVIEKEGEFKLKEITIFDNTDSFESKFLVNELTQLTIPVKTTKKRDKANLILSIDKSIQKEEAYKLIINSTKIQITASTNKGLFYGTQSVLQLIRVAAKQNNPLIQNQSIEDEPRFSWRAFMLDEARFFKGKEETLRMIDEMAALKMNVFHWHLTDDAGWRIEIKKYPLLTEIGSKRKDTQTGGFNSKETLKTPHSGFYTQDEIKEILAYAKQRHIVVVPEIEMPGHASAAIASYPWLSSSEKKIEVPVFFGKHYAVYNVADEKTISFLKEVVTEVIELFDTNIIHIGGDEVRFDEWETNKEICAIKEKNNFTSFMDVQIDFTNKMSRFIEEKGVRMMGWNEILGLNLHADDNISFDDPSQKVASNVIVQFWKGDPEAIVDAVKQGYEVVNSHHTYTYLDYSYESIPLEKSYSFEPVSSNIPSEFTAKVIGIGCQMWGEWIPTVELMHKQTFPRLAALAEVAWSSNNRKDYKNFTKRINIYSSRWDEKDIKYSL